MTFTSDEQRREVAKKLYEAFKTVMECSLFLAMAIVPWFLLAFVIWMGVAW